MWCPMRAATLSGMEKTIEIRWSGRTFKSWLHRLPVPVPVPGDNHNKRLRWLTPGFVLFLFKFFFSHSGFFTQVIIESNQNFDEPSISHERFRAGFFTFLLFLPLVLHSVPAVWELNSPTVFRKKGKKDPPFGSKKQKKQISYHPGYFHFADSRNKEQ